MIGFIIWAIGLVLTVKAVIEVWRIPATPEKKLIVVVLIIITNWLGLLFYYFWGRNHLDEWLK